MACCLAAPPGSSSPSARALTRSPSCDTAWKPRATESRRVIFVDQLEELFTAGNAAGQQQAFVSQLLALLSGNPPTTLVLAIRADQIGHCAEHPELAERMAGNDVLVGPMTDDELSRAVEGAGSAAGLEVDRDSSARWWQTWPTGPGALPLLSTALLETWERRRGRVLTLAGYREAGGVQGAVARFAESAFAPLNPSQQRAARRLLLHLADVGHGRPADLRRRPLTEILSDDDADATVALDVLVGRRIGMWPLRPLSGRPSPGVSPRRWAAWPTIPLGERLLPPTPERRRPRKRTQRSPLDARIAGGGAVEAVAFSPNGRVLAVAAADGSISLWDTATEQRLGPHLAGPVAQPQAMPFSPTGREIVHRQP